MKTKYRIVRRWTTKINKITGKIIEQGADKFYIQYRNIFTILFEGGWTDLHLFSYSSVNEAQKELNERLEKNAIKEENHEQVVFIPYE
jgi:hypothetical protein